MNPEDVMKLYEARLGSRRFEEVQPIISEHAVFWFTDGTYRGIASIRDALERTWRNLQNEVYWLEDLEWIAADDAAASCIYRFCWRADIAGRPAEGSGRGTTVLRKEHGDWKIVHEHLSSFPLRPQ